jgi:TolA-binding protein
MVGLVLNFGCGKRMSEDEMFTQANNLQMEGKYKEAIEVYIKISKKFSHSPKCPQAQFMIGFIYANELKDLEKAKLAYEEFLKKYPEHEMAKDARWELEHLGQDINDIQELTKSAPADTTITK